MADSPRVSFLGPEATFTHEAAIRHFGEKAEFIPAPTIASVFEDTESGRSDMGVVPPTEDKARSTMNPIILSGRTFTKSG